ncbi:MAG: DUF2231 domain-containing protein [Rhizomicrobium sp.]
MLAQTPFHSAIEIGGRPLRHLLAPFMTAFLAGALAADAGFVALGQTFWAWGALWLLAAGFLAAAFATTLGLVDFLGVRRDLETAWRLFGANALVAVLSVVNFGIRCAIGAQAGSRSAIWLSVVSVLLLFLGGGRTTDGEAPLDHLSE